MNRILAATAFSVAIMAGSSAAVADNKLSAEASLCQRDVLTRIQVEHPKGKVDFNNKGVSSQSVDRLRGAGDRQGQLHQARRHREGDSITAVA